MSSVGLDIGNSSCVVTIANQGKLQDVLNKDSENETPSVVSFGDKRRRFGSEATASLISNPASTVSQLKRLIGKDLDFIKGEFIDFPFKTSADDDGEIFIHVNHRGEEYRFKPVHILAMLLSHLKQMVEKNTNKDFQPISHCVIGVPSYFTDKERIAYRDAAEIAGMKDPQLMHEGAAIALGYRFCRSTEITESISHIVVVFIDIGHCDTQVTVVKFQGEDIHVLAQASDPNLGGRDFDKVLLFHFAKEFKDKFKVDIIHNPKACAKLIDACEKLKMTLTTETISSIHVENLMDGKELFGSIKREKFEELSTPLVERIFNLCLMALSDARLSIFQDYSIELVGSGAQIPIIKSKLEEYFPRPLGRMLNGNELVSRGCALQASRLSLYFQITPHKVHDSVPFQVWGQIYNPSLIHSNVLFHKGANFPNAVSFQFKNVYDAFELHIFVYQNNQSRPARVYKVRNVAVPSNQLPILEAKVGVDHCGIINLYSVALSTRQKDPTSMITAQVGPPTELQITDVSSMGMLKVDLIKIQEVEAKLVFQDKSVEAAQSRRNELEAYVVETRKKLNDKKYEEVVSSSEKDEYLKRLVEMEKYLGDHDESTSYTTKLDSLKEIFIPIDNRQRSSEDCAQATRDFEDCINMERASANSLQDIVLLGAVHIECGRADEWLKAWRNLHELLPKSIDKGRLACVIRDRKKALQESCKLIHNNYQTWLSTISADRPQALYPLEEKDQGHTSTQRSVQVDDKRKQNADEDKDSAIIDLLYSAFLHRVAAISSQKHKKDTVNEECTRVEQWLMSKIKVQDPVLSPSQIREEIDKLNRICEDQLTQAPRTGSTYLGIKETKSKDEVGKVHDLGLCSISNPSTRTHDKDRNPSVYLLIIIGQNIVGRMVIQLFMDVVPKTAENFLALCTGKKQVSYLGSLIHQVVPGKSCLSGVHAEDKRMIVGVPSFAQENFVKKHSRRGMVSMMTDLHTPTMSHGSGFIICFGNAPELDGKYVVFGEITEGMDVLDQIEAVGTSTGVTTEEVMVVDCGKLD